MHKEKRTVIFDEVDKVKERCGSGRRVLEMKNTSIPLAVSGSEKAASIVDITACEGTSGERRSVNVNGDTIKSFVIFDNQVRHGDLLLDWD